MNIANECMNEWMNEWMNIANHSPGSAINFNLESVL